jgi:hypothetical protein
MGVVFLLWPLWNLSFTTNSPPSCHWFCACLHNIFILYKIFLMENALSHGDVLNTIICMVVKVQWTFYLRGPQSFYKEGGSSSNFALAIARHLHCHLLCTIAIVEGGTRANFQIWKKVTGESQPVVLALKVTRIKPKVWFQVSLKIGLELKLWKKYKFSFKWAGA